MNCSSHLKLGTLLFYGNMASGELLIIALYWVLL